MSEAEDAGAELKTYGGGDEDAARRTNKSTHLQSVSKMPADEIVPYYNMNHKQRGIAIIFNHEHFDIALELDRRTGTNVDCDNLFKVLKSLGFKTTVRSNLRAVEINKYINEILEIDHSENDCLLIAVLTHGKMDMLYAKDTHYKPDNLWCNFTTDKCPTLAGKPKIFLIQACQGDNFDEGMTLSSRTETDGSTTASYVYRIHVDVLIVLSTVPGYLSWRNSTRGSWFVQALCEELCCSSTEKEILTLLTSVVHKVALDFESNTLDKSKHQKKQVPCIISKLIRLFVFGKK